MKPVSILDAVIVETNANCQASVILMHGLGADGYDFEPIVAELHLPEKLGVRFVFPHAPIRPVTLNNGMPMRAWFDLYALSVGSRHDKAGIQAAEQDVHRLIQREIELGVAEHNIVLAGFSQGGALALYAGLRYPRRLAGILGLSTMLPLADELSRELVSANNKDIPILMTHGTYDAVLPIQMGEYSKEVLRNLGYRVDWKTYPMAHSVCPAEINDISIWLQKVLNK